MQRRQSRLTRSQLALARYILQHDREAPFLSSAQLAGRVSTSDATVTRFCSALGYQGYADLQKDLQKYLQMRLTPSERLETIPREKGESLYQEIIGRDIQNLKETAAALQPRLLKEILHAVNKGRRVFILGLRSSFGLAALAHSHLSGIRKGVVLADTARGMMADQLADIGPGDVMLAISFPRYTRETLACVRYARGRGCRIIGMTDSILSPLARISDLVVQARVYTMGFINSYTSAVGIINCLSAGLSMMSPKRSIRTLKAVESELKKWKTWEVQDPNSSRRRRLNGQAPGQRYQTPLQKGEAR
ncbi:MAG TPA: MurR/RpiR family transcriptional regulator [Thermodesulfobacteriota bacterium]|nr:MurR/RpiR family transcriptional regulator [Thermodesulfobacteriota bacterium]